MGRRAAGGVKANAYLAKVHQNGVATAQLDSRQQAAAAPGQKSELTLEFRTARLWACRLTLLGGGLVSGQQSQQRPELPFHPPILHFFVRFLARSRPMKCSAGGGEGSAVMLGFGNGPTLVSCWGGWHSGRSDLTTVAHIYGPVAAPCGCCCCCI